MKKIPRITAETLRRDRERREDERDQIADSYDKAANNLEELDALAHREAIALLRSRAAYWRR